MRASGAPWKGSNPLTKFPGDGKLPGGGRDEEGTEACTQRKGQFLGYPGGYMSTSHTTKRLSEGPNEQLDA